MSRKSVLYIAFSPTARSASASPPGRVAMAHIHPPLQCDHSADRALDLKAGAETRQRDSEA